MRFAPFQDQLKEVVGRFAYIKETQYGVTWSVRIDPTPGVHLFQTGLHLQLHTDMNYRENSPGMQLLHCLKVRTLVLGLGTVAH